MESLPTLYKNSKTAAQKRLQDLLARDRLILDEDFVARLAEALVLTGALFIHFKPPRSRPDVAAVIISAQNEIARLSIVPPSSFPV